MLTRASRRRHALHYFQQAAENIQLPWLCPALAQPQNRNHQQRSIATRPRVSHSKTTPAQRTQLRHLASPATVPDNFDRSDEYIPFAYGHRGYPIASHSNRNLTGDLSPFDLSQILMLDS